MFTHLRTMLGALDLRSCGDAHVFFDGGTNLGESVAAFYGADIPEIQKGIRSGSEPDDVVFLGWKPKDALRPHALGTKVVKAKRVLHSVTVV